MSSIYSDWTYEFCDYEASGTGTIAFDSFMVDEASLEMGDQRQLTVDNSLVLPVNTSIRILLSSNDVIHLICDLSPQYSTSSHLPHLLTSSVYVTRRGNYTRPCYVTGQVDAEGSFNVNIDKSAEAAQPGLRGAQGTTLGGLL